MPPRLKSTAVVAFVLLVIYLVYAQSYTPGRYGGAEHVVDVLKGNPGGGELAVPNDSTKTFDAVPSHTPNAHWQPPQPDRSKPAAAGETAITNVTGAPAHAPPLEITGRPSFTRRPRPPRPSEIAQDAPVSDDSSEFLDLKSPPPAATHAVPHDGQPVNPSAKAPGEANHPAVGASPYLDAIPNGEATPVADGHLQDQFKAESEALGLNAAAGAIYGTTLKDLETVGSHDVSASSGFKATGSSSSYSDRRSYIFNPYPEYNSQTWKAMNLGLYKPCFGPSGEVADLKVYSGHLKAFSMPSMGSYLPLKIDDTLCFERETRLGPYGFVEGADPEALKSVSAAEDGSTDELEKRGDWDKVDWGLLQRQCFKKNANRYASVFRHKKQNVSKTKTAASSKASSKAEKIRRLDTIHDEVGESDEEPTPIEVEDDQKEPTPTEVFEDKDKPINRPKYTTTAVSTEHQEAEALKYAMPKIPSDGDDDAEDEDPTQQTTPTEVFDDEDKHAKRPKYTAPAVTSEDKEAQALKYARPKILSNGGESESLNSLESPVTTAEEKLASQTTPKKIEEETRTAVLVRTHTDQKFTDNDSQNIRALVSELCLRSGGEYEIYILAQVKDESIPIWTDASAYRRVVEENIPQEFWNLTILWNDHQMKDLYPLIPPEVNNVHQSQWLSVQKFAQDHPEFDYFWNWEFDTRYTGQYYDLFEKLDAFTETQPRRYLWERNERFYIPHFHGRYAKYMKIVERLVRSDTIWGPPVSPNVTPTGPPRPSTSDDAEDWGVGEAADYVSLAPMFNPVGSTWPGRDDVWGYDGVQTPRRATIGTTSRCSKKLLKTMHDENLKGNHVRSEMTPQTVSLLHGFKAVFAPVPVFFDKPWKGAELDKFFNPGPKHVSGSTEESPFSLGKENRFEGSTWYYGSDAPIRLYNNWLGWEDHEIGGAEWEKEHGRVCLPPMLLHPIKNIVKPPPGYASKLDLPYQ